MQRKYCSQQREFRTSAVYHYYNIIYRAITRHHIYIISLVNRKGQDLLVTLDVVIQFMSISEN